MSAKLPGTAGTNRSDGIWPAHWMMPNDKSCWPDHGEIDIMEMIDGDGQVHGTYHWNRLFPAKNCTGSDGNTQVTGYANLTTWRETFHEYAVEWDVDYVDFYLDGVLYNHVNASSKGYPGDVPPILPTAAFYILLNTAVGGPVRWREGGLGDRGGIGTLLFSVSDLFSLSTQVAQTGRRQHDLSRLPHH